MALSVNADHHSLPFHGSAYVWEAANLGLCLMEQHCVTAFNHKPSSPLSCSRVQAGERGGYIQNRGKAAGGED